MNAAIATERLTKRYGGVTALDTPEALKRKYDVGSIDEVFRIVAADATRGD